MIVDDDVDSCGILAASLARSEHVVRCVTDPRTALNAARAFEPAVILLDLAMPALDGFELARRFRAEHALKGIPLIAISGLDASSYRLEALSAGCVDYWVKPFELQRLERFLDDLSSGQSQTLLGKPRGSFG